MASINIIRRLARGYGITNYDRPHVIRLYNNDLAIILHTLYYSEVLF